MSRQLPPCDHDECPPTRCLRVGKANEQRLIGCDALVSRRRARVEALHLAAHLIELRIDDGAEEPVTAELWRIYRSLRRQAQKAANA